LNPQLGGGAEEGDKDDIETISILFVAHRISRLWKSAIGG
jgi:hypothetical protein